MLILSPGRGATFQTGEGRGFVPGRLVGKGQIGQTETGAVVLVEIAWSLETAVEMKSILGRD